jgi:hypothetical protein
VKTNSHTYQTGDAPSWLATAFHRQCLVTARLIHPRSREGQQGKISPDRIALVLRIYNTRGSATVACDMTNARLYTFTGHSIPALPLPEPKKSTAVVEVPVGAPPRELVVHFSRASVLRAMERLYALQLTLDRAKQNLPGQYYQTTSEALRIRRAFEKRLLLLPKPDPKTTTQDGKGKAP